MHSNTQVAAAIAALAMTPLASAHGFISGIVSGGQWYSGTSPEWIYHTDKPETAGWYATNQDNGYVAPDAFANPDIICHRNATVGLGSVPVTAGEPVDLQWNTWPESHHGPVITYMAAVSGEFAALSKEDLNWFKIDATGLIDDTTVPGNWATDVLMANNLTSTVTIPSDIAAGNYVLRHEIIALHSAGQEDGAQAYPQCVNVVVTGSGTASPCDDGAECAVGTALYTSTDPGILINIYQTLADYTIPGPALYGSGASTNTTSGNGTVKVVDTTTSSASVAAQSTASSTTSAISSASASMTAQAFCA